MSHLRWWLGFGGKARLSGIPCAVNDFCAGKGICFLAMQNDAVGSDPTCAAQISYIIHKPPHVVGCDRELNCGECAENLITVQKS